MTASRNVSLMEYLFIAGSLFFFLSFYITMPFIPRYAVLRGATSTEVALLGPALSAVATILMPITGMLVDKGFSRRIVVLGVACSILSNTVYALSFNVQTLYVGRILQGISLGLLIPASIYIATLISADPASTLVWRSIMVGVAMVTGPVLGGALVSSLGYSWLFAVPSVLLLLSLLMYHLALGVKYKHPVERTSGQLRDLAVSSFIISSICTFSYGALYGNLALFLPALHEELGIPVDFTASAFTVNSLFTLASRLMYLKLFKNTPINTIGVIGYALTITGMLLIAVDQASYAVLASMAILGAGGGLLVPVLQIMAVLSVKERSRGLASGISSATFDAGNVAGPPLTISLYATYTSALKLTTLFAVLGAVAISLYASRKVACFERARYL
ncbi:MAG: MFS transporter [Desulfurococcaceae archaeon]